jgi:hypothetical protein
MTETSSALERFFDFSSPLAKVLLIRIAEGARLFNVFFAQDETRGAVRLLGEAEHSRVTQPPCDY